MDQCDSGYQGGYVRRIFSEPLNFGSKLRTKGSEEPCTRLSMPTSLV
jgi:hypothetical protein